MVRNTINEAIPVTKTRGEIARAVGISRPYLQALMAGRSVPTVEMALRIAKALNKPIEQLYELLDGPRGDVKKLQWRAMRANLEEKITPGLPEAASR